MARSDPQVNLRMPAELKDALDAAAAENKRSLTAEVVARLQASIDSGGAWAKTFPSAAASAFGDRAFQEATAALVSAQIETSQLTDRLTAMDTQLVNLDAQAIALNRDLMRIQLDIEQADARKDGKRVAALLKQRQETTTLLSRVDSQAAAIKRAIHEVKKRLMRMRVGRTGE